MSDNVDELRARRETIWPRLLAHSLDDTQGSYHIRRLLCSELRIDESAADELVLEYKRFMLIAGTADHPCSPSAKVDEVWHLHLSEDSQNYYSALCSGILERIIFHDPHRKSPCLESETINSQKFWLAYESFFGTYPPPHLWNNLSSKEH